MNTIKTILIMSKKLIKTLLHHGHECDVELIDGEKLKRMPKISFLVPTKDNFVVFERLIKSLQLMEWKNYEVIVFDNGSNQENKAKYNAASLAYGFKYLYKPIKFNYSKINNFLAKRATGEYLLFVNDDVEVVDSLMINTMMSFGMKDSVGAVGCKLLYPNSSLIQHVGIHLNSAGPRHMLYRCSDDKVCGINNKNCVVPAVTGACMLVEKKRFEQVKGFDEKLPVAFNDVDLCCKLAESKLENVVCNETYAYHHESISRGSDYHNMKKFAQNIRAMVYVNKKHDCFLKTVEK